MGALAHPLGVAEGDVHHPQGRPSSDAPNALTEGWGGVFALSLPWPGARVPSVEHPQELSWKVS